MDWPSATIVITAIVCFAAIVITATLKDGGKS